MAGINATHPSAELGLLGGFNPFIFEDNDPPQILPIGDTPIGNLIFLVTDPDGDDYGSIGLKIAFSQNSFRLADNVEEFFERLREPSE